MSIDILIICFVFSELYLKKRRKIASLNKRVGYSILLGFVLLGLKLPMAWDMSKAKDNYIPMPFEGLGNFSDSEIEIHGVCIWSFTYFYPIWAPVFYGVQKYRELNYEDYQKTLSKEKSLEDCNYGNCESLLSEYAENNDRVNFIKTLSRLKVQDNLKCFEAESYSYYAKKFQISFEEMKGDYGIDLFKHLRSGCYGVVETRVEGCIDNSDYQCAFENKDNILSIKPTKSNYLISRLVRKTNRINDKSIKDSMNKLFCDLVDKNIKMPSTLKKDCRL